jgi:hypothetical protein
MSVNSTPVNGVAINAIAPPPPAGIETSYHVLLLYTLLVMEPGEAPPAPSPGGLTTLLRHRRKVKAAIARRYQP